MEVDPKGEAMATEMHRMAAMMAFSERYGCTPNGAALAAFALHPLDDALAPGRAFEKTVRKESRRFGKAARNLKGSDLEKLARETVVRYKALAQQMGETHYTTRYDAALASGE